MASCGTVLSRLRTTPRSAIGILAGAAVVLIAATALAWWLRPGPRLDERAAAGHARGIQFLLASQAEAGHFPTYYWPIGDTAKATPVHSVFTTAQILYAIAVGTDEVSRRVQRRAIDYLISQREPPGIWRYYGKDKPDLLSPDVDDTAVAWAGLIRHGHRVTPEALAALEASRDPRGRFNVWIGDPSTWVGIDNTEVDMVVNVNGLLLFALAGKPLDEVCRAVVAHATSGAFSRGTVYYPSPLAFAYTVSRVHADAAAPCVADAIPIVRTSVLTSQRADGTWGDDLETAHAVLTLLNSGARGEAVDRGIEALLARQSADGGWAMAPAYRAAVLPLHYGSRPLTTAIVLDALARYLAFKPGAL